MRLRIACIQCTSTCDQQQNLQLLTPLIHQAAHAGAQLISLPEAVNTIRSDMRSDGYFSLAADPFVLGLRQLAANLQCWIHCGSAILRIPGQERLANTTLMIDSQGEVVATYQKIHLFQIRHGKVNIDEGSRFEPGKELVCATTPWGKTGLSICYDLRYSTHYHQLQSMGATLLAIPAAFTRVTGKAHWHSLLRARAIENACFVFAAAQGGKHQDGRTTYGHSMIIDPWGGVIAELANARPGILLANLDSRLLTQARTRLNAWAEQ